ncbi:MAG: alpha/beta fold hydrolase [Alphaproteobacteria bacterium]
MSPQPMPEGGTFETFTADDGAILRYALWPKDGARATVILQGGFTEFIEKHFEAAQALLDRGFAVAAMDWRSQGLSHRMADNPHKVHAENFERYLSDFHQFIETIVTQRLPGPCLAMAHSMGGHLTVRYLHDHPDQIAAAVLCAPMIDIHMLGPVKGVVRRLTGAAKWLGLAKKYAPGAGDYGEKRRRFEGNELTSDPARFKDAHDHIDANPALAVGGPTIGWLHAALDSINVLDRDDYLAGLNTPICLIQAGQDTVVLNEAQDRFAARVPSCELHRVDGAKHEILRERDEFLAQFWQHADPFLASHR